MTGHGDAHGDGINFLAVKLRHQTLVKVFADTRVGVGDLEAANVLKSQASIRELGGLAVGAEADQAQGLAVPVLGDEDPGLGVIKAVKKTSALEGSQSIA